MLKARDLHSILLKLECQTLHCELCSIYEVIGKREKGVQGELDTLLEQGAGGSSCSKGLLTLVIGRRRGSSASSPNQAASCGHKCFQRNLQVFA